MTLPRKYDGLNFPLVCFVMANEMVARADAGFENLWGLQDCAETLNEFGSEELKAKYLPRTAKGATWAMTLTEPDAGSDLGAVMLKASGDSLSASFDEKSGKWLLNGVKRFITNGDGDISLVLARTEEGTKDARGLSMLVYDRASMCHKVRRIEDKFGIKGSPTCELVFTDAPAELVGDRKMGLIKYVMALMNAARLGIGAQSIGLCEAAYREGLKYANERAQFGKTIINFPAVYEMLNNAKARIAAGRALLYETTRFVEIYKTYEHISHERELTSEERTEMKFYSRLADAFTPMQKLFLSEYANSISYDMLQIHGGSGYMKDYPIERIVRDARITNIYEGTSQLQVVAAINHVTKGTYMSQIEAYEAEVFAPEFAAEFAPIREKLTAMKAKFAAMVAKVEGIEAEHKGEGFKDFHARRLVESAGHIIMTWTLAKEAAVAPEDYTLQLKSFALIAEAAVSGAHAAVEASTWDDIALYRTVLEDKAE
jgi:alkylation response protein AidB-like acyl-CoA dehydrogenase